MTQIFEKFLTEREQLVALYMDTNNNEVLEALIKKYGYTVLLELDVRGYSLLSDIMISNNRLYHLFNIIDSPKLLKRFADYVIDKFTTSNIEDQEDYVEDVLLFIKNVNWLGGTVTKPLMRERINFFVKLCLTEKVNVSRSVNFFGDIMESMVLNTNNSMELLLSLIPSVPEISERILMYLHLKISRCDIFTIISAISDIRHVLMEHNPDNKPLVDELVTSGIDEFLLQSDVEDLFMNIFVSVNSIATYVIEYRKEEFILFFERFTVVFKSYKEDVEFYIENYNEQEGIFPLGNINEEISRETATGLAYALYHGNTIRQYHLASGDTYLMNAITTIEKAFNLYIIMEVLPDNWLESDDYYNAIIGEVNNDVTTSLIENMLEF